MPFVVPPNRHSETTNPTVRTRRMNEKHVRKDVFMGKVSFFVREYLRIIQY